MQIIKSIRKFRKILLQHKNNNKTIGFVPTMGALHEGHLSLIRSARRDNDIVVLSIFVNPKQFGPKEDFAAYPREEKKDISLAKNEDVDIILYPSVDQLYPEGHLTHVNIDNLDKVLCGKSRPGHFRGVATIVAKLLNIVTPDKMYLGQKDVQQAAILKKMVADLNFTVTIKTCKTAREKDGLALSSRNKYLTNAQRKEAPQIFSSLNEAKHLIKDKKKNTKDIIRIIRNTIERNTSGKIDYVEILDADNLKPVEKHSRNILIALAVQFGKARLIDNIIFSQK